MKLGASSFFANFFFACGLQEYSVLDYEEKVVDGFYDAYGLSTHSRQQGNIPSLTDLENNLGDPNFEVITVNRKIDHVLEELMQVAQCIALDCSASRVALLVSRLAEVVTGHMGGPVKDANIMSAKWMERSTELRTSLHTGLLPIGTIDIGLSRHRALLFKVRYSVNIIVTFLSKGLLLLRNMIKPKPLVIPSFA